MQCEVWWIGNDVISLEEIAGDSGGTFEPIVSDLTPTFVYFSLMLALSILYSMLVGIVLPFVLHFQWDVEPFNTFRLYNSCVWTVCALCSCMGNCTGKCHFFGNHAFISAERKVYALLLGAEHSPALHISSTLSPASPPVRWDLLGFAAGVKLLYLYRHSKVMNKWCRRIREMNTF